MKAKTEEYAFQQVSKSLWRLGYLLKGTNKNLTTSEYQEWLRNLHRLGYVQVRAEDSGAFQVWGREVEVDLEPSDPDD